MKKPDESLVEESARSLIVRPSGDLTSLEDFIPYQLAVIANRISQAVGRLFEDRFNLQIPEWRILMVLHFHGKMPFNEIVERTSMDKARVSRAHRRLADLKLVKIWGSEDDRRIKSFSLTPLGKKMCIEILPHALGTEAWLLDGWTKKELADFRILLNKLGRRIKEVEFLKQNLP